ncbi:MAG: Crp/Fnr family transcriptional regulator [Clostridium sp.]|nr:Crp/Fnr family transcriptional regulator [Clostridium sp.]
MINSKLFSSNHMIESKIKIKAYKKGQFISDFFDGEYYVGIIEKGEVSVYCISRDGNEVNMSLLKEGDIFGIANIFEEEDLDTVLKCKSDVKAVFYPKKDYIEMMQKDSSINIEYIRYCNKKIQFLLKRIEFLNIQSSKKKLIEHLLEKSGEDDIILLECSKEELSKILSISRASLYRELQLLQSKKYLDFDKNIIKILDKEKLKKYLYEI